MVNAEKIVRQSSVNKGAPRYENNEEIPYMQIVSLCHVLNLSYEHISSEKSKFFRFFFFNETQKSENKIVTTKSSQKETCVATFPQTVILKSH